MQLKLSVKLLTNTLASEVGSGGGLILSLSLSQIRVVYQRLRILGARLQEQGLQSKLRVKLILKGEVRTTLNTGYRFAQGTRISSEYLAITRNWSDVVSLDSWSDQYGEREKLGWGRNTNIKEGK